VQLITAHRILIVAAIAFFLFYALFQVRLYWRTASTAALVQAVVAFGISVGFRIYYRSLARWFGRR